MKYDLPPNHGLSAQLIESDFLVPKLQKQIQITDIQYDALAAGVARGESLLVVAPTSTGKTLIGMWAVAACVLNNRQAVYLVTHRALARQKFEEFKRLSNLLFEGMLDHLVIATGDEVTDGNGNPPDYPLGATILVATYEKFLALLSSAGVADSLTGKTVVCDEIQLLADKSRGELVEVLLTVMLRKQLGQLLGLSAVLSKGSAERLSEWLSTKLLYSLKREKKLTYRLIHNARVFEIGSGEEQVQEIGISRATSTIDLVKECLVAKGRKPIIVFCMTRARAFELADTLTPISSENSDQSYLGALFPDGPTTSSGDRLLRYLARRIAVHSADLTEEEREAVEKALLEDRIDVVFATSTLAAGVNFPISTVIFDSISRQIGRGQRDPIDSAEFHNMAGRAGRLGLTESDGLAIFRTTTPAEVNSGRKFLDLNRLDDVQSSVPTHSYPRIALQLVAASLCSTRGELIAFFNSTFSAHLAQRNSANANSAHRDALDHALKHLRDFGFIVGEA